MNTSELFKDVPQFLVKRYVSINKYVWENLFPEDFRAERLTRIQGKDKRKAEFAKMKQIADEATLVAFIFLTKQLFSEGSNAAKKAVDAFKELEIDGFYIGSTFFQGRNPNVLRGERLVTALLGYLKDERLKIMIRQSHKLSDIISEYKEIYKRLN
jgi:hypothetical protein